MKHPIVVLVTATALAGCSSSFAHSASTSATHSATASAAAVSQLRQSCSAQAAWNKRGQASVNALYAATGALAADARANNATAVTKAGRKLASDALAAATLPLPPMGVASWKTLTADYAAAGTTIAGGAASGAVPQLEEGNSAISAFSAAIGKCAGLES
jgi:hypothetical protein